MPERVSIKQRAIVFRDLGILEYKRALALQVDTRAEKLKNPDLADQLFFVQHPSVFTFGKNGGRENRLPLFFYSFHSSYSRSSAVDKASLMEKVKNVRENKSLK